MKNELKQLIASSAPVYIEERRRIDAQRSASAVWYDAEMARSQRRHTEALSAVSAIFDWIASPVGQELLSELRATGLGKVQLGSSEAALFSDGCVELFAFAKQWSQRWRFQSAADFVEKTENDGGLARPYTVTCFDQPAIDTCKLIADGTILDKIAEHLKK